MTMIPSLFAILCVFLAMRLTGIPLNIATILIGSTILGATENDQIHFFYHFQEGRSTGTTRGALRHALLTAGRPIVFATLINVSGFLALALSDLPPMRQFGIVSSSAFVLALLADFTALFRDQNSINTTTGFLVNDRITVIKDRLIFSLGGRYDRVHQIGEDLFAKTRSDTHISAKTVQSGLNYNLTPNVTLYSSYSTSFSPQTVLDPSGNPFPNQKGKGYDAGVKMDLFRKQLFVTATYFDIVYDNIVQQGLDPVQHSAVPRHHPVSPPSGSLS